MWVVSEDSGEGDGDKVPPNRAPGWFCHDNGPGGIVIWPGASEGFINVDLGSAIMMCDILNARDYPDVASI